MISRRILPIMARAGFGLFLALSSTYCLLAYVPFTRHTLIDWNLVGGLAWFAKYHVALYWVVTVALGATLIGDLYWPKLRRLTAGFMIIHGLGGVALWLHPVLPNLPNDERAFIWSLIFLFPMFWIVGIDYKRSGLHVVRLGRQTSIATALAVALFLTLLYLGTFYWRYVRSGVARFSAREIALLFGWSLAYHLLLLILIVASLGLIQAVATRFRKHQSLEPVLFNLLAVLLGMILLRQVVLPGIFFTGSRATLFAFLFSLCLIAFYSVSIKRFSNREDEVKTQGRSEHTSASPSFVRPRKLIFALGLILAAALAYFVPTIIAGSDWNGLVQRFSVLIAWGLSILAFRELLRRITIKQTSIALYALLAIGSLAAFNALEVVRARLSTFSENRPGNLGFLLDRYSDFDMSFRSARDVLGAAKLASPRGGEDEKFYAFLRKNTNISDRVMVRPVDVNLTADLKTSNKKQPHIFIFVIDSLRADYVSPYNSSVNFTPSIQKFAAESVVMENAFTRYGGTALAEASIWTGGMQLHKQFIQPFRPMNSLQKLAETDGYQSLVTIDPILRSILDPSPDVIELDSKRDWLHYDFTATLEEIKAKLETSSTPQRPVFVYTQPQDIHLVTLKMNGKKWSAGNERYRGFEEQRAGEIELMDSSFGRFVDFLKDRGLYDQSIIVLTSDHGDSLGEEGHWGHHSLFPEVVRIPLIIHLPGPMQKDFVWDSKTVAFSTDIAPSLYYLLGHKPILQNPLFGRPIFTTTRAEQTALSQDGFLIANSYEPVWGILATDGRQLYIADAGNLTEYSYDLSDRRRAVRRAVTDAFREECRKQIRGSIDAINRFYNFNPEP